MTWTCDDWNDKPYMRWVGARVVLAEGGRSRVELPVLPHHRGAMGTEAVNGAILAYLHDVAQGVAVRSLLGDDVRAIATLNLNISYVDAMAAETLIVGVGRAISIRSAVAFAESEFLGMNGQVCCRAAGTFRILRTRRARPAAAH
jgi:acyl-coenzyme A thioesterase PaaI-like protein